MAILFYVQNIKYKISGKRKIKNWINEVLNLHNKKAGEINIILTDDDTLLELNKKFLKRDYYTDILTFEYSNENIISGDLFISLERIKENAKKFSETIEKELKKVIIHGILHLLGFKDRKGDEEMIMRKMENKYIKMVK